LEEKYTHKAIDHNKRDNRKDKEIADDGQEIELSHEENDNRKYAHRRTNTWLKIIFSDIDKNFMASCNYVSF
jgi:hypothetical protein